MVQGHFLHWNLCFSLTLFISFRRKSLNSFFELEDQIFLCHSSKGAHSMLFKKIQLWMNTMLKLIRDSDHAIVACKTPNWECLIINLPDCTLLKTFNLNLIRNDLECHQIRCDIDSLMEKEFAFKLQTAFPQNSPLLCVPKICNKTQLSWLSERGRCKIFC